MCVPLYCPFGVFLIIQTLVSSFILHKTIVDGFSINIHPTLRPFDKYIPQRKSHDLEFEPVYVNYFDTGQNLTHSADIILANQIVFICFYFSPCALYIITNQCEYSSFDFIHK